jgi:hypothetical protein
MKLSYRFERLDDLNILNEMLLIVPAVQAVQNVQAVGENHGSKSDRNARDV